MNKSKPSNRSKYNVGRGDCSDRTFDGIVFDSAMEMRYYRDVITPQLASGEITHCERQKSYTLQPAFKHGGKSVQAITYKADFYTVDKYGKERVIDIKGCPDAVALLKRKMFWYLFPSIEYVWIGYCVADGGWTTYENILQGRRERKKLRRLKENKDGRK